MAKLVPRRSKEEREKNHIIAINKRIQEYIKNGRGDLYLNNTPIKELPDGMHVTGNLDISDTHIKRLPNDLTVDDSLLVSKISYIPNNLRANSLIIYESPVLQSLSKQEILDTIRDKGGNVNFVYI